jgi:hypothetical protein
LQLDQLGLEFDNGMRDDAGCQRRPPVRGARSGGGRIVDVLSRSMRREIDAWGSMSSTPKSSKALNTGSSLGIVICT